MLRLTNTPSPQNPDVRIGQYTIFGAGCAHTIVPLVAHDPHDLAPRGLGVSRIRLPIAALGSGQNSRARFSLMTTTGAWLYASAHFRSRPASTRLPIVPKWFSEIHLNRRSGGIRPGGGGNSSTKTGSWLLLPSIVMDDDIPTR